MNFEMPSARQSTLLGLARSNHAALDEALQTAGLGIDYPLYAGMELVPTLFGGLIPTDIQGIYRNGVPTASTAVDSPWYHTVEDTPDKVDTTIEAQDVDDFDKALGLLLHDDTSRFAGLDDKLWQATLTAPHARRRRSARRRRRGHRRLGVPQANAPRRRRGAGRRLLRAGDSARRHRRHRATRRSPSPPAAVAMGAGNRFVHVSSGPDVPVRRADPPAPLNRDAATVAPVRARFFSSLSRRIRHFCQIDHNG